MASDTSRSRSTSLTGHRRRQAMVRKAHRLAARVGRLLALAIGCGAVTVGPVSHARAATDVTTFGYDLQRTGNNPAERVIGTGNVGTLSLQWSAVTGRLRLLTQPLVAI